MLGVKLAWVSWESASNRLSVCPNTLPSLPTIMVRLLSLSLALLASDTPPLSPTMVTCTHGALIFTARQATVIPKPNGTPKESHMTSKAKNYLSLIRWPAASLLLTHLMCKDIPTLGVRDISVMVERLW